MYKFFILFALVAVACGGPTPGFLEPVIPAAPVVHAAPIVASAPLATSYQNTYKVSVKSPVVATAPLVAAAPAVAYAAPALVKTAHVLPAPLTYAAHAPVVADAYIHKSIFG